MSLLEVLLAGALFFGSSVGSLLAWSRALATLQEDARRAELVEGLDAELQAAEMRLRDPALLGSPAESCEAVAQRLAAALQRQPALEGVERQIETPGPQPWLRLRLVAADLQRERIYHPAAFAGCGTASVPPPGSDAAL